MFGGLYGDLPAPSAAVSSGDDSKQTQNGQSGTSPSPGGWSANKMAPPTVRKNSFFAAPASVLRNQGTASTPKIRPPAVPSPSTRVVASLSNSRWSTPESTSLEGILPASLPSSPADPTHLSAHDSVLFHSQAPASHPVLVVSSQPSQLPSPAQPALVGASSAVVDEYDPGRPNNYEEFRQERRKKKAEEEMRRQLERRRREEEERERDRELTREAEQVPTLLPRTAIPIGAYRCL